MILNTARAVFILLVLTHSWISTACTIFMANDGKQVWVGNNEDESFKTTYRLWYYPARREDFGYMIWTELAFGKLFYGLMYKNPQGGLNEHGLFMDYTAIEAEPIIQDPAKINRRKELIHDLLKRCKSVDEAIQYLSKYNLLKLREAQLFIADATGDYATIHGGYLIRKAENNFVLTNYCIKNGYKQACYRRDVATNYLNTAKVFTAEIIKEVLQKSAQKQPQTIVTNFSMAVNLKAGVVHLYYQNDFANEKTIILKEELQDGKHHKDLVDYFPKDVSDLVEQRFERKGIFEAIATYKELRTTSKNEYNFTNNSMIDVAIKWIENRKIQEAILLLKTLSDFDPHRTEIYTWLGVAYRKANQIIESDKYFAKALELHPGDYLATLWGRQLNQKVVFHLNDFEGAEQVWLMGEFTQWKKNALKMNKINGVWTCEAVLPKGEHTYKFRVNDKNLTDKINRMHVGKGPDVYSKLYVW